MNETTLKNWYLVTFEEAPEPHNQILWGTISEDSSGRWYPGDWCCTSLILSSLDGAYVTKSTRYTVEGPGKQISLPLQAHAALRGGVAPDYWHEYRATLQELERLGYQSVDRADTQM